MSDQDTTTDGATTPYSEENPAPEGTAPATAQDEKPSRKKKGDSIAGKFILIEDVDGNKKLVRFSVFMKKTSLSQSEAELVLSGGTISHKMFEGDIVYVLERAYGIAEGSAVVYDLEA